MTKHDYIQYWITTAKKDWRTVQHMYKSRDYLPALFFAHLHIEKLCKALWVKNNTNDFPPKTHNLVKLLTEANVHCTIDRLDFLIILNNFQLDGRYPDYMQKLYKTYKSKNTSTILAEVKQHSQWLQSLL